MDQMQRGEAALGAKLEDLKDAHERGPWQIIKHGKLQVWALMWQACSLRIPLPHNWCMSHGTLVHVTLHRGISMPALLLAWNTFCMLMRYSSTRCCWSRHCGGCTLVKIL